MQVKGMGQRKDQKGALSETKFRDIPTWARDNLVLKMLNEIGLNLEVVYDKKYLHGICDKPLIVISSRDKYISLRKSSSKNVE